MSQAGLSNRLDNEIRFVRRNGRYDDKNMHNINILSRHHKRITGWKTNYRNKYSSPRWIHDGRGCGWGCIVEKKRFKY